MSRSVRQSSNVAMRASAMKRGARAAARGVAGASLMLGFAASALAQQSDGMIAIPGNAETNPAAVAEMAKSLGSSKSVAAAAPAPTPAPVADMARASGYRTATSAADAAMRHAALALEARAEAADDAMDDAGGMIVVPGPGEAKPTAATPAKAPVAVSRGDASATSAAGVRQIASRDVMPVVVMRDDATPGAAGARPIAPPLHRRFAPPIIQPPLPPPRR